MTPYTLQSHEAIERWDEIEPLLQRIETPDTPLQNVREMVRTCEAQVWCVGEPVTSVCVTKLHVTQEHKYGLLWMGAGNDSMTAYVGCIEAWMREKGCKYVELIGRRGWKKLLPDYHEHAVILVKELT